MKKSASTLHIEVRYIIYPGKREEFMRRIAEEKIGESSRAESGNYRYEYFYPVGAPDEVFLLEEWESAEAQRVHCDMPHFKKLGELKKEYVLNTVIERSQLQPAT